MLDELKKDAELKNAVFIQVNFDMEKDFKTKYNTPSRSVVVVFKGGKETSRSAGKTDKAELKADILKGV